MTINQFFKKITGNNLISLGSDLLRKETDATSILAISWFVLGARFPSPIYNLQK